MFSIVNNQQDIATQILNIDVVNVNFQDKNGLTALMFAIMITQPEIAKQILDLLRCYCSLGPTFSEHH